MGKLEVEHLLPAAGQSGRGLRSRSQFGRWVVVGVSQMNLFQGKFAAGRPAHLLDRQTGPPSTLLFPLFFCTSLVMGDLRLLPLFVCQFLRFTMTPPHTFQWGDALLGTCWAHKYYFPLVA